MRLTSFLVLTACGAAPSPSPTPVLVETTIRPQPHAVALEAPVVAQASCAPPRLPESTSAPPKHANGPAEAYAQAMHYRIHPVYADEHLVAFDERGASAPVNAHDLCTALAFTVTMAGGVVDMEVVHPSGVSELDEAAVHAVRSVGRFPRPPEELGSRRGVRVYWEFRRDEAFSCTTMFTRFSAPDDAG